MKEQMTASQMRSQRKRDHIDEFMKKDWGGDTGFGDIFLSHQALPEIDFEQIDTSKKFLGKTVAFPFMINAMTGGFEGAYKINEQLATLAKKYSIPMAVGSQSIAVKDADYKESFTIVRKTNPKGVVIGNLNAFVSLDEAKRAVDMLEADALQIHLNPAQEIVMPEGDRDFTGRVSHIETLVNALNVPVIVKEVGFGISKEAAKQLADIGVKHIDIAGFGGTNFIEIESGRREDFHFEELANWGIPTALALIECRRALEETTLIASGGMRDANDVIKALCVGADMVGMSGTILKPLLHGGYEAADAFIENLMYKSKIMMLLLGKAQISALSQVPYRVTGRLRDLLEAGHE